MPYLVLGDFKGGLDTSRRPIAGGDGILSECVNCHITRGGELERRKSMASFAALPTGTHGLHGLNGDLTVFGTPASAYYDEFSADTSGEWSLAAEAVDGVISVSSGKLIYTRGAGDGARPRIVRPVSVTIGAEYRIEIPALTGTADRREAWVSTSSDGSFASAITMIATNERLGADFVAPQATLYIVIRAGTGSATGETVEADTVYLAGPTPAMPAGVSYMRLLHPTDGAQAVSEILDTESFDGKIYAIAKFSDGSIHHYFNGSLVADWDVLSQSVLTTGDAVAYLAELINRTEGLSATSTATTLVIEGPEDDANFEVSLTRSRNGVPVPITNEPVWSVALTQAYSAGPPIVPAEWTVTVDGTSSMPEDDLWTVNAGSNVFTVGRRTSPSASLIKAHRSKMHAATESVIHFSGINEPASFLSGVGWGFFNLSNQESGSQNVTAIGNYQGRLAFFTREYVQIWNIDEDETLNTPLQTLRGVGTRSPHSVIEYGGIDTFFVHSSGIRSLRQRQGFDSAAVEDIGTPIDSLVVTSLRALTDTQIRKIKAALEPETDRLWFAVGSKVFVYSFFPSRKIRAWSTYDFGFTLDEIVTTNGRLYARAGNTIYLYGGASGVVYPAADEAEALVRTPFLEMGKPGHLKQDLDFDVAVWGEWEIDMLFDPENLNDRTALGTFDGPTFGRGILPAAGQSTHVALEARCSAAGEAGISLAKIGYMAEEP